ncbi:MAG: GspH/FimT family pseudopilin [Sulfuricellaceae bacterium]|nr:GspH/FimT family pseudopilin [Sulfuricellaceae bacterium]
MIKAQRGMTLIELSIGLLIVSILLAASAPSFMAWIQNTKIRSAAESLQNGLQVARNEALRRNANVEFRLGTATGWQVVVVGTGEVVQERSENEGSVNVTLAAEPAGAVYAMFTGLGRVSGLDSAGDPPLTQLDIDVPTTVLSAADSRDLRITIGIGGQVRMCDPNISATGDTRKC